MAKRRVFVLVVNKEDVQAFCTLPFLEAYCKQYGITQYSVREQVLIEEDDKNGK